MSLVSPDSTKNRHNGVSKKPKHDIFEKKTARDRIIADNFDESENEYEIKYDAVDIKYDKPNEKDHNHISDIGNCKSKLVTVESFSTKDNNIKEDNTKTRDSNTVNFTTLNNTHFEKEKKVNDLGRSKNVSIKQYNQKTGDRIFNNGTDNVQDDFKQKNHVKIRRREINKNKIKNSSTNTSSQNKIWQKKAKNPLRMKKRPMNSLNSLNEKCCKVLKLNLNSRVLISFLVLNAAGLSSAVDASTFSSGLTSRMIASFLGYPSTCTLGSEVRACTLTISCWMRGGTRFRGCGGWLFSCCGLPDPGRDDFDNSIPSSEWKYKPPSKLRPVPKRNVLPNNVLRRRVDDDVTQMDCGLPASRMLQKRIIGGREARFAEFPWQAHVRISEFQCGGVLVSRRYVATAAHCVSRAHTRDIAVWLGAIDTSATHHPARKLGVIQKILHPLFQFRMTQPDRYDIALLRLSRAVTYMSHILPICLPDHEMDLRGRSGVIAGWGKTDASNGHTGTNLLRSAVVPILSKEQCINWHQSKQISVQIHSEMICAGHSDGHQDACLGDSGGPLIVLDNGRYYLVGITSAGFGCGVDHQPGIYHNVKLTANWIRSVISPAPSMNYNDNYLN